MHFVCHTTMRQHFIGKKNWLTWQSVKLTFWLILRTPVQCERTLFPASFTSSASRKNISLCIIDSQIFLFTVYQVYSVVKRSAVNLERTTMQKLCLLWRKYMMNIDHCVRCLALDVSSFFVKGVVNMAHFPLMHVLLGMLFNHIYNVYNMWCSWYHHPKANFIQRIK